MRLNRYIAAAGITSRRKADELIKNGNVKINGVVVKEPGPSVGPDDRVEVNGKLVQVTEKKVYLMLNKPNGYITSMKDQADRPVVRELVEDIPERVFPVGRLDYNTTGLLIMTNDGELANRLAHPSHHVPKTSRAEISGVLSPERVRALRKGVDIGGYVTRPAKVKVIKHREKGAIAEIEITEGKNRQVRKMFSAVGCKVMKLERVAMGELYLGRLASGHYRKLTRSEIEYLKSL